MRRTPLVVVVLAVALAACTSDGDDQSTPPASEETAPLEILVTNDDGVGADGIDALVEGLREVPDVSVSVVAPAENQSGTGTDTTTGDVASQPAETSSGYPATAVDGFPSDAIAWALDGGIDIVPDVVVSGVNAGQNIGPATLISGTVGAAHTAVAAGIPALAVSAGIASEIDYSLAVELAVDWVSEQRDALLAGDAPLEVVNINVPTCPMVRELVEVPVVTDSGVNIFEVDCESTLRDPMSDVEGFVNGYAVESVVPPPAG